MARAAAGRACGALTRARRAQACARQREGERKREEERERERETQARARRVRDTDTHIRPPHLRAACRPCRSMPVFPPLPLWSTSKIYGNGVRGAPRAFPPTNCFSPTNCGHVKLDAQTRWWWGTVRAAAGGDGDDEPRLAARGAAPERVAGGPQRRGRAQAAALAALFAVRGRRPRRRCDPLDWAQRARGAREERPVAPQVAAPPARTRARTHARPPPSPRGDAAPSRPRVRACVVTACWRAPRAGTRSCCSRGARPTSGARTSQLRCSSRSTSRSAAC